MSHTKKYNVGLVFQYFVVWTTVHAEHGGGEAFDLALEQIRLNDGFDFSKCQEVVVELIE